MFFAQTGKGLTKRFSGKPGTRSPQPLGSPVDGFDQILIQSHLHGLHTILLAIPFHILIYVDLHINSAFAGSGGLDVSDGAT
jgi:hypothetical protein